MGGAGIYVGVDCGSQGTKAVAVDGDDGRVVGSGYVGYGYVEGLPQGHREQHPETWVDAMTEAVRDALAEVNARRVEGIGVSGQQHGFVPLDAEGEVIRPAKLWNDTSTAEECRMLIERLGGVRNVVELTGNTILPGFTAGKILWFKRHEPRNYTRLAKVLLPHDYLNFWLTGRATMEAGDASGTALMDVRNRRWSREAVEAIDPELMKPEERETLQELMISAANEAAKKARELAKAEMAKLTGGLDIPGMLGIS